MATTSEFLYEQKTLEKVRKHIRDLLAEIETARPEYGTSDVLYAKHAWQSETRIILESALRTRPYDYRLDFREKGCGTVNVYYNTEEVGFASAMKNAPVTIVSDEAPIAELFNQAYAGKYDDVVCETPGGALAGDIVLFRQLEIQNDTLVNIEDLYNRKLSS